ncbi:hypothetical protein Tco_1251021, partial [Tanacetum coccineum]
MSGEEPTTQIALVESPQMVSTVKLPIPKKGEYTLWSIRMKQYLTNTDYSLWQVILSGDGPIQVTTDENGIETEVPPKSTQALLQRQRERKAKSILLLAIPDEYQLRFHGIKDAKSLWAAIKSRFGGNVESKKMQKNVLKKQFENFFVSDTKGLDRAYDRFQKLISILEVHGAAASNKDVNKKFLRALPLSWNYVALIMRNKDGVDDLDIDDLYNNLKVFEVDIKGYNSQGQASSSSYADDLMGQFARECGAPRNQGNKNEDAGYSSRDNTRRTERVETSDTLVVQDNALILGLESVEAQLIVHQKNEVVFEENIAVLEFEVKDKSNAITRLKNQLDETLREKDDLKAKLEYVFDSRSSDGDDNHTNDRFKKDNGYHTVSPPLTGNYMPPLADLSFAGLDDSVYRPTTNKNNASVSQVEASTSQTSNTSVEMPRVESV